MSDDRNGEKSTWSSVLLVAAVVLIVFTGFMLKANPYEQRAKASGEVDAAPAAAAEPVLGTVVAQESAPEPASTAAPVAAVEPPPRSEPASIPVPAPSSAPARIPDKQSEPAVTADPLLAKLAERADRDRARLAKATERYTAQLVVACKPETVDRLLAAASSSSKLYVLPARLKDDACFRICYGTYASMKDAGEATDLPKALRGKDKIAAVEIAKVLL